MKPLPAQQSATVKPPDEHIPALPGPLASPSGKFSTANRRTANSTPGIYSVLLVASTATAALFCFLYIAKPVMISPASSTHTPPNPAESAPGLTGNASTPATLMPSGDRLPGEPGASTTDIKPIPADPRVAMPGPPSATAFEETNLRIQHILTAEAPGGHLDRIDIDVPVLYHSRNLRWTSNEVTEARELLLRLMDYQEKSRQLRSEGVGLLNAWNRLIDESIPSSELRADSPSLPENQHDAADAPRSASLITTESIQIKNSGK